MADSKDKTENKLPRKVLVGEVISLSGINTAKVRIETKKSHPKYGKVVKSHKNYLVECNEPEVRVGDKVTIGEGKPVSKNKSWYFISKLA